LLLRFWGWGVDKFSTFGGFARGLPNLLTSGGVDGDPGGTGTGFGADDDLDIVSEGDEETHEAFDGVALQLVVEQGGDFWLRDIQQFGNFGLGEALLLDDAADGGSETGFGVEFFGVGELEIGEDVAGGGGYSSWGLFRHGSLDSLSAGGPCVNSDGSGLNFLQGFEESRDDAYCTKTSPFRDESVS
jgi:hypothetical protein